MGTSVLAVVLALAPLLLASQAEGQGLAVAAKLYQAEAGCSGTGKSGIVSGCRCCYSRFCVTVYLAGGGDYWDSFGSFLILSPRFSWIGVNLRGNFLLRSLILLLPTILTLYCLFGKTSTTTPLLEHLRALLPAWFCTMTLSPSSGGACLLTWVDRFY